MLSAILVACLCEMELILRLVIPSDYVINICDSCDVMRSEGGLYTWIMIWDRLVAGIQLSKDYTFFIDCV